MTELYLNKTEFHSHNKTNRTNEIIYIEQKLNEFNQRHHHEGC